jgi:hypothetical protein
MEYLNVCSTIMTDSKFFALKTDIKAGCAIFLIRPENTPREEEFYYPSYSVAIL